MDRQTWEILNMMHHVLEELNAITVQLMPPGVSPLDRTTRPRLEDIEDALKNALIERD